MTAIDLALSVVSILIMSVCHFLACAIAAVLLQVAFPMPPEQWSRVLLMLAAASVALAMIAPWLRWVPRNP